MAEGRSRKNRITASVRRCMKSGTTRKQKTEYNIRITLSSGYQQNLYTGCLSTKTAGDVIFGQFMTGIVKKGHADGPALFPVGRNHHRPE